MESLVHILGAFPDTLVLMCIPLIMHSRSRNGVVDPLLQEELMLLKEQAQEIEEDVPDSLRLQWAPLLMRAKRG